MKTSLQEISNEIESYMHCRHCLSEAGAGPYLQDLEVGWTPRGIQVWCRTHQCNLIHLDLRGREVSLVQQSPHRQLTLDEMWLAMGNVGTRNETEQHDEIQ